MTSAFTMDIFYSILTLFYLFYRGDRVQQFSLLQIKGMAYKGQIMFRDNMKGKITRKLGKYQNIRKESPLSFFIGIFKAVRKLQLSLNWSSIWRWTDFWNKRILAGINYIMHNSPRSCESGSQLCCVKEQSQYLKEDTIEFFWQMNLLKYIFAFFQSIKTISSKTPQLLSLINTSTKDSLFNTTSSIRWQRL